MFSHPKCDYKIISMSYTRGPRALDSSPESLSQGEDVYHKIQILFSPKPQSILGITQIKTKAYQGTKFNQNINLSAQFQCLTFLPNPKGQGCALGQTFYLHTVLHLFSFNWICNMTFLRPSSFWPIGHNLNKHGRGPLGAAT